MSSVFTKIMSGELPGHFIWKDDICAAFLSINPIATGHTLVVPVLEVDHWLDLPPDTNSHLINVAQIIGQAQMTAYNPERVGIVIAGFEVPHTHLHVIPINGMQDLDFTRAATTVDQSLLSAAAVDLTSALIENGNSPGV
ncbi:MAG: hypothetical protein CL463_06330 [Acidimicrobiaceae bacterium]|nr:hypothetical protein [Acidimicrobiaceae bacterium]